MTNKEIDPTNTIYETMKLSQKRNWYSPAVEAYNTVRPKYPQSIIKFALDAAHLTSSSRLLEIGSGPGTATTEFASRGLTMVCIEPNPDFVRIAINNCKAYQNVKFINCAFEDWSSDHESFDSVLAATSLHWVSAIAYPKIASSLVNDGYLVLLWNMVLRPIDEINQRLSDCYQLYAPKLIRPETDTLEKQAQYLTKIGRSVIESGLFKDLDYHSDDVMLTYSVGDYLSYLSTSSHFIALKSEIRDRLFNDIRKIVKEEFGASLLLTYRSACHVAKKL